MGSTSSSLGVVIGTAVELIRAQEGENTLSSVWESSISCSGSCLGLITVDAEMFLESDS